MSGGSYNYLSPWRASLEEQRGAIESMAVRLEGLSWGAQAGAATRRILALPNEANQLAESLKDAWHAIEWWDSCDWDEDQAREDVEPYTPPDGRPAHDVLYRLVNVGNGIVELRPVEG